MVYDVVIWLSLTCAFIDELDFRAYVLDISRFFLLDRSVFFFC